jgi:hypothetical protein
MNVRSLLAIAIGALLAACGSSSSSGSTGTMNVSLVDGPSSDYLEVNVDVQTVQIRADGDWIVLGSPGRVVNLLALTGGVAETLVNGATLPAGHYGQMRLVLGSRNTVKLLDGSVHDLKVPSGQQSGVKLTVSFDVQPGTTSDVFIDFDAHRSVFVHEAGKSGKYLLRPTVRAFDRMVTGSISGTLRDASTAAGLPGVVVTAQVVTVGGPSISRSTTTDATGHYLLDLLPLGGSYFVVSQPVVLDTSGAPLTSYEAKSSRAIAITEVAPVAIQDQTFATAAATGTAGGAVTPAAVSPQVDTFQARLPLDVGGVSVPLIVRSVGGVVDTSGETYTMTVLPVTAPATTYTIVGSRRGLDADGNETVTPAAPVSAVVPAGGVVAAPVAF